MVEKAYGRIGLGGAAEAALGAKLFADHCDFGWGNTADIAADRISYRQISPVESSAAREDHRNPS